MSGYESIVRPMLMALERWRPPRWVSLALAALIFSAAAYVVHRELGAMSPQELRSAFAGLNPVSVSLAAGLAAASFACLIANEALALKALRAKPASPFLIARAAFTAYALSNAIGLSFATAPAVRARFYRDRVAPVEIARASAITGAMVMLGAAAAAGLGLLLSGPSLAWRWGGALLVLPLLGFVALSLHPRAARLQYGIEAAPSLASLSLQAALAVADWACAAGVLYVLSPSEGVWPFSSFLAAFVGAGLLGAVSGSPGGAGVFEAVLLALAPAEQPTSTTIAALLAYRVIYTIGPLILASALLAHDLAGSASPAARRTVSRLRSVARELAPVAFSALAFLAGLVLLLSSATPALAPRLQFMTAIAPLFVIELSHFFASLTAVLLLLMAAGLWRRLEGAWAATLLLLGAGIVFALFKGGDYEEAGLLGLIATALYPTRGAFLRKSRLLSDALSAPWLLAVMGAVAAAGWLGFFAYRHVEYTDDLWWSFLRDNDASRFLRAGAGVAVVVSVAGVWTLLDHPKARWRGRPSPQDLQDARAVIAQAEDMRGDAYLALLGDKDLFFSESRKSFIAFRVRGARWLAMSEPCGLRSERLDLMWRFAEVADTAGAAPVFYAIGESLLPAVAQLGFVARKIGESALVPLSSFSLEGKAKANLRNGCNKAEREGASFELLPPGSAKAILDELKAVSDAWLLLHHGREKAFSLGRFDAAYLDLTPLAVVRCGGRIGAFANVWTTPDKRELSVDLMRYDPAIAPKNAIGYMFVRLMEWGRAQGFAEFDLGMAPFSGLPAHRLAPLIYRLGAAVFEDGEQIYGFKGLRAFKEKFDPIWRPSYIAMRPDVPSSAALLDVALLTSGGWLGLIRR